MIASDRIVAREIEGEMVLLNLDNGRYFVLNETGSVIWKNLADKSRDQIVRRLTKQFDVTEETAEAAVTDFINALIKEELLCESTAAEA